VTQYAAPLRGLALSYETKGTGVTSTVHHSSTQEYLRLLGVPQLPPLLSPFDPGYDLVTLESHLDQSGHLMASLKISMACWLIADEEVTRRKFAAAREHGVASVTGGGPFEVAVAQGVLPAYLDLCADMGVTRIECGEGFTELPLKPRAIVQMAHDRGLAVQFELGKKHEGHMESAMVDIAIRRGHEWLEAGAEQLVIEARESAEGVGLFDEAGALNGEYADRFARDFDLDILIFEAPTKSSQFALLEHFGQRVRLGNVRLEEVLRVEIYRRGLHSDAFSKPNLKPTPPKKQSTQA
jgi:phosphosulfolactate synthase